MSLGLDANQKTILSGNQYSALYAVKIHATPAVLAWQGVGNLVDGGDIYVGADTLLSLDLIQNSTDLSNSTIDITMSGLNSSIVTFIQNAIFDDLVVEIKVWISDENLNQVGSLKTIYSGLITNITTTSEASKTTVVISVATMLALLRKPSKQSVTHQYQRQQYSGDDFLQYQAAQTQKELIWKV